MTVDDFETVKRDDILGPLLLDQLHKTGRSVFLVEDVKGEQILGMVDIRGFLRLDSRQSFRVSDVLATDVPYIRQDDDLDAAVRKLMKRGSELAAVKDGEGALVGVVYLQDCIEQIL